jgi:hypothetical protein
MPSAKALASDRRTSKTDRRISETARVGIEDDRHASEAHRHATADLLVEAQQPDREGAGPEIYARSDAITAAMRAGSLGGDCRSIESSNTTDILRPLR